MRSIRLLLAGVVAALAVVLFSPAPSYACSCAAAEPVSQYAEWADVVVVGRFEQRTEPDLLFTSADPVVYTVSVDRVLEGSAGPTVEVLSPASGASCGLEGVELGRRYVVFASHMTLEGEPSDALWSLLCGGTQPVSAELLGAIEAATGPGTPPDTGAAYSSTLSLTFDRPVGAGWAVPVALSGGAALALLTGGLWLRLRRAS